MKLTIIAIPVSLAVAACGSGTAIAASSSPAAAVEGHEISRETHLYSFEYSYPAEAARIRPLRAMLDADAAAREKELSAQAREYWNDWKARLEKDLANAQGEQATAAAREALEAHVRHESGFNQHYLAVGWSVSADLSGWLSLGAGVESYSGGAHGNHGFDSLLWDKAAGKRRKTSDLFLSRAALREAIHARFCDALDKERAERRGEPVQRDASMFHDCIDPLENTVLLESDDGAHFDKLTVLVAPYMAGPYVEGSYLIELPVSAAIRAAVKPDYRDAFGPAN